MRIKNISKNKPNRSKATGVYYDNHGTVAFNLHGDLDLIKNPSETRFQIRQIVDYKPSSLVKVRINLAEVNHIESCCILYLVAVIEKLGKNPFVLEVSGSMPSSLQVRGLLEATGWKDFLKNGIAKERFSDVIAITKNKTNTRLESSLWGKMSEFALRNIANPSQNVKDAFYGTLSECVENVKQHAYGEDYGPWYAMALPELGEDPARAVIVDVGMGIPKTIKKTGFDKVMMFISGIGPLGFIWAVVGGGNDPDLNDDRDCVLLATLGQKTRTDDHERGTGLNGLRELAVDEQCGNFTVMSGAAMITWKAGDLTPVQKQLTPLPGTIICFDISASSKLEHDGEVRPE